MVSSSILWLRTGDSWAVSTGSDGGLMDCVYFSISNYTSLGMGDIQPIWAGTVHRRVRGIDRPGADHLDRVIPVPGDAEDLGAAEE